MMFRNKCLGPALGLAFLALGGCLDVLDPSQVPVSHLGVTIGADAGIVDTISVRSTARVRVIAYSSDGFDIGLTRFQFTSSNSGIATVDSTGTVRGISPGQALITARIPGGKSGTVTIVVLPSTIAYTIPVGYNPHGIAFSSDFTRGFVLFTPDSVAIIDAFGYYRLSATGLGIAGGAVAATASEVYVTHPSVDSVSVLGAGSGLLLRRMWVGAVPDAAVAHGNRAYIATRADRKVVVVDNGVLTLGIPMNGEPHHLALSRDGARMVATVERADGWHLVGIAPLFPDTIASTPIAGAPRSVAISADGSRAYVLLAGEGRVVAYAADADGRYQEEGSVVVGPTANSIAARHFGTPYLVVSGEPLVILHGETLAEVDRIASGGNGFVAIRPDGIFAFIAALGTSALHVIPL